MNTGDPELHYETIETRARPARIAVLMDSSDSDWRHTVVRIIEFLSSVWGGKHSVIVPTNGSVIEPVFWAILEKFSPDYVYFYRKTWSDIQSSHPEQYAGELQRLIRQTGKDVSIPDHSKEFIDRELRNAGVDRFALAADLRSQLADRLVPFHFAQNFQSISGLGPRPHQLTGIADVLPYVNHPQSFTSLQVPPEIDAVWWAARVGEYSQETVQALSSLSIHRIETEVSEEDVADFASWVAGVEFNSARQAFNKAYGGGSGFMPPDETKPIPFDISMSRIGLYGSYSSNRAVADRLALVLGDALADFCLSYCLPRIGHPAIWLPMLWIKHLQTGESTVLKNCARSVAFAAPSSITRGKGLKICSVSEEGVAIPAALEALKQHAGLGLNGEKLDTLEATRVVALVTVAPTPFCLDSPNQSELCPFLGDRSVGVIRSPRPTGFSKLTALKHRWVSEVRMGGRAVPTVPHVAEDLVILHGSAGTEDTRVSQHALAYACPGGGLVIGDDIDANLGHPEIRRFDTFTAVSLIAEANGFECHLSDKGIYQRDSLEKFGGVAKTANLLRGQGAQALDKFLDHNKRGKGVFDEGCVLDDRRTYLDLAAVQKALDGDEKAAITLLDDLTAATVLQRGFVLGCAVCKHVKWYSLADLADQFRCTRCGREQTIRRQHWRYPSDPRVFYKLDEITYQFLRGGGGVVALGLDYMARCSEHPFDYSPEIQFRTSDPDFTGEIDLCAVWDGLLTIGEAKKQGELASSRSEMCRVVKKYIRLTEMLNARRVVFCTTSPEWTNSTREAVEQAFQGRLAVPWFLTAEDLYGKPTAQA